MKSTAKEYGLEVNANVDERNNLILSTTLACKYLLKAKERFGSWTLAAASYNAGMNGIASELKRQSVDNYYDMLLGQETGRYVFRIVALKEITSNAKKYALITRMQTCTITPLHFQWRLIQPLVILCNLLKGLVLITSN